jgi:hypothetical protein
MRGPVLVKTRAGGQAAEDVRALLRQLIDGQRELVAQQTRQHQMLDAILQRLDRVRGARDQADVALLLAVAAAGGDRRFTSAALLAHAQIDPALHEALLAADIVTPQDAGLVFRRMEGINLRGFRIAHVGNSRAGIVWQVQFCEGCEA